MATTTESTAEATKVAADSAVQATEVQEPKLKGWENIKDADGFTFSAFGISIVFIGLLLTFCYISLIPFLVGERKPKVKKAKPEVKTAPSPDVAEEKKPVEGFSPELQAAIAYVIAAEQEYEQLTDYTKITIRRDENQQAWGVAGKMRTLATRKLK